MSLVLSLCRARSSSVALLLQTRRFHAYALACWIHPSVRCCSCCCSPDAAAAVLLLLLCCCCCCSAAAAAALLLLLLLLLCCCSAVLAPLMHQLLVGPAAAALLLPTDIEVLKQHSSRQRKDANRNQTKRQLAEIELDLKEAVPGEAQFLIAFGRET